MAINPYLTAFLRNPLSPIQAAGSAVAQKIRKPVESLATEIARPAVVAGGLLYTGMKSGITGKNEAVDLGRFGKVSPIINPENIADTSGSRLVPETALGLALTASTLGTGNVARAAGQSTLKTAVQTLGRSPLRNIASIVSPIQTGLAKLPVAGRLAVPVANTAGQAAKRFAVQGTTDFLTGAATSLAADKAAGRGYNVKNAAVSGGISTLFPLGVAGVTGTVRGASRGASARGVVRTVLEDADLLTRSAVNPAKGNFGRVVHKALEDKEAQLAERVATQTAQNIKLGEATIESRFLPSFIQKAPKTKDEAKLKAVKFIRDFSKNFIDDRAPITTNLSGKLAERGATPEEVSALADAVSSLRASDSMTAGKLNRVREGMDSLRPQGVTEVEFQSALNAYADKKTKLETTRADEAGIAAVRQELDDLTSKLAPEVRQAVEQAHEQFVVNFNRELLEEQVEAGVYSREFADELLKKYPNYSKLIVKDYLEKPLSGAGKTVRSDVQGLKVAGRDVNAAADLESLPAMEANAIGAVVSRQNAERNKLVRNAVDLDAQYKTGTFEKVDAPSQDTVTLRRDGVEEHYKVKDRQVLEFFQGQQKKDEGTISKLLEAGADMTRLFATSVNPAFMIGNTIRDFLTSGGMMRGGVPVTLNNWAEGYDAAKTIILKGEGTKLNALAQKALDIGVPLTTYSKSGRNTDDVIGAISNLSAEKQGMLKTVERYNNISEVATRLAVLDAAMKSGITDPAALRKIARDATVDFQVAGTITRELNRKIPFLNARIQGLRNVLKRIGDDPAQVARQAQTLELAAQTILQGWNAQYGDLEKRISTQEKQDRFVMITGSYKDEAGVERPIYVSLPKGSFGQFVGVLRDAVVPNKDDKRTTKERSEDVLAGFIRLAPIDGIPDFGGAIFQTIRGIQSNKDWRGYDIVPAHLNKPEVSDRAKKGKTTSRVVEGITRGISKATGGTDTKEGLIELSPAKVEYVVKTLFSGSGTQAISAADMFYNLVKEGSGKALNAPDDSVMGQASKLPILSSFVRSRGLSVDPTVEKRNVEEIRNMSLLDVVEDDKAKELKARVLKAATPEERLKILKESDPETVKQVIEDAKKKVFIEGVNPYSPVEDQAIQITNALEAKSTPEARRELLQNLQQRGLLTEKKMEAMFAYKIARQVNTLSPEEKQALIQGLSERGVLTQEFLEQVARYRIMQQ